ncbi:MAG: hypothetical protein ACRC5A_02825 [Enterobacteriaceae bacterium]
MLTQPAESSAATEQRLQLRVATNSNVSPRNIAENFTVISTKDGVLKDSTHPGQPIFAELALPTYTENTLSIRYNSGYANKHILAVKIRFSPDKSN